MARALNAAIKPLPGPCFIVPRRGKSRRLCPDGAEMEKQLVKLDEEGEEAIAEPGKIGPIHFVDVDFALFAGRRSTRLNSSHGYISYAVFCLKKKNKPQS